MNPFLGQILMVAFNFAPVGWALCNGQLLAISQNTALFSLLGTYYGGNGTTTFALPNLQGRVPVHMGSNGSSNYVIGQSGGAESATLTVNNLPAHSHTANCNSLPGTSAEPVNNFWAETAPLVSRAPGAPSYAASTNAEMAPTAIGMTGGNLPVSVVDPYLCMNFIIALQGIYPSRS
jgi:microcystin-dependent protein